MPSVARCGWRVLLGGSGAESEDPDAEVRGWPTACSSSNWDAAMSGPVGREQSREDIWRGPTQNGKYGRKRGEISEVFRVYSERGTRRMNYGLTLLYTALAGLLGRRLGTPLEGGQPALKNNQTGYRGTSRRSQVSVTRLGGWEHA